MSVTPEKIAKYKSWDVFRKLEEILEKHGSARVYLVPTSCGLKSPKSTAKKLQDFANAHDKIRYAEFLHEEWGTKNIPALTTILKDAETFITLWEEACKIRARGCGCSVFISDGQEIDVRVMEPTSIAAEAR